MRVHEDMQRIQKQELTCNKIAGLFCLDWVPQKLVRGGPAYLNSINNYAQFTQQHRTDDVEVLR